MSTVIRINIGCGQSPTPGWRNFDNSPSLKLANHPVLASALRTLRLLDAAQLSYIAFASKNAIEWSDATKQIDLADGSVDVLYTSHMLEHLDRTEVTFLLREAKRVLKKGGVLRIVVPDLALYVRQYLESRDADAFIDATFLAQLKPRTISQKIKLFAIGGRHHYWMYDGASLCRLLDRSGFQGAATLEPGRTRIPNPGSLDLFERVGDSVYVEAVRE